MDLLKLKAIGLIKEWLHKKAAEVNQASVMKTVYQEVDITAGYFLVLTIANLIALTGLITNNTAVIIGAMLISPLMGPILSSGFAFITGNEAIGRKAFSTIVKSVAATIAVAAFATWLSPLNEVTQEILARTRPNLYDLVVAFLAGLVGAIAICTKRNYITIVPGVAIATAVIPPLSVAGFGLGSANFSIALGGFFLFFTNFVAIIISTCIVFFVYGFRPGVLAEIDVYQLKKRIAALGAILFVISIPLLYTLHVSLSEIRLRSGISAALKRAFDTEKVSYLSTFDYRELDDALRVRAAINTTKYLEEGQIAEAEKSIEAALGRDIILDIEQVLMQAGGLKPVVPASIAGLTQPKPDPKKEMEAASLALGNAVNSAERILSPYRVSEFYLGRKHGSGALQVFMKVRRDSPFTPDEALWLEKLVSEALGAPVALTIETQPLLDPITLPDEKSFASDGLNSALRTVSEILSRQPRLMVRIEARQSSTDSSKTRKKLALQRAEKVKAVLVEKHGIPAGNIVITAAPGKSAAPLVSIKVVSGD
ncbi:MAG: DUF389 domain-containing protein [Deltaproteobacteria bacterium]|nr:DUF389 domain-containing protein [Deltaproteobacteria bacterium]MBZ0219113.1 DUF389 domain-containing protein [Deltaproteobacteria bacterium]